MSLILAQGADHTDPAKLKQIILKMNADRQNAHIVTDTVLNIGRSIIDKYGVTPPKPLLARLFNQSYVAEEKYDGYSYLNDGGRFFSKRLSTAKGNEGKPVEKTGHLPVLATTLRTAYNMCGCDLHGELYMLNGISDSVSTIMGCNEDEAVRREAQAWETNGADGVMHYMLIDIRKFNNRSVVNEPYYVRRALLEHVYTCFIKPYDHYNLIRLAEILEGDPRYEFTRIVKRGGEGIIIKRTDAQYIPDKKPANNWIKGKKKITLDVVITGFNDGTGKNKELFGSFEFGLYINGKLTPCGNCSSGLNDATRQLVASNPDKYIGHVMEITAIQESVKSFRNAVFLRLRDDKGAEECTPLNIRPSYSLIEGFDEP